MSNENIYGFRSAADFQLDYNVSSEPLGTGGFGTVFPGSRRIDGRKVAVKQVPLWQGKSSPQTSNYTPPIPKELQLLRLAQSCPGVIRLYDSCRDESGLVLVMEYNEDAQDLLAYINENGILEEPEAAKILRQLVRTLQSCQEQNIFHRDVKLENILYDMTTGETTLIDFGCGEMTESPEEVFTEYFGSRDYVPPEFYLHDTYSPGPSTVWAIGCVAFSMIFGYKPFRNKKDIKLNRIKMEEGTRSSSVRQFILQCLNPVPTERGSLESLLSHPFLSEKVLDASEIILIESEDEENEAPTVSRSWRSERSHSKCHGQTLSLNQFRPSQNPTNSFEEYQETKLPQATMTENENISSNILKPGTNETQQGLLLKEVCVEADGELRHKRNSLTSQAPEIRTTKKRPLEDAPQCAKLLQNKFIRRF